MLPLQVGCCLLAQDPAGGGLPSMVLMFGMIGVLFYFMILRPQKREQARVQEMQGSIKKSDQVVTVGGIVGTVVNAQQGSAYVTIKIDESTNTKMRVMRRSISRVVTDGDLEGKGDDHHTADRGGSALM